MLAEGKGNREWVVEEDSQIPATTMCAVTEMKTVIVMNIYESVYRFIKQIPLFSSLSYSRII